MYLIERLGQLSVRDGVFAGTLGDSATDYKAQFNKFLDKVRARPKEYKKLLLSAHMYPFPKWSPSVSTYTYPVENLNRSDYLPWVIKELQKIADAELQQEIKAERKLWDKTLEALNKVGKSKLKQWLVPVALRKQKVFNPTVDLTYLWRTLPEIGRNFAKDFLGSVGQEIFNSEASETHLVQLGWVLVEKAGQFLGTDPAFKKEVEKERKKQASKPK